MKEKPKLMPAWAKFVTGGLAGVTAGALVQPMDLVKTRLQMTGEGGTQKEYKSTIDVVLKVLKQEGIFCLYRGLGASALRQLTYTTVRLGIYQNLFDRYKYKHNRIPPLLTLASMGFISGLFGGLAGTPADVIMIRMMMDGNAPAHKRRNYKNTWDALRRIYLEEGLKGLYSGCYITVGRAIIVNTFQLASYSEFKYYLYRHYDLKDSLFVYFATGTFSGFITTIASMPVDIVKTRLQNMQRKKYGEAILLDYVNSRDVITKIIKHEGFFSLWKGFIPYVMRLTRHTALLFIFLEQYNKFYYKYLLGTEVNASL